MCLWLVSFLLITYGAIEGARPKWSEKENKVATDFESIKGFIPLAFKKVGYDVFAVFREKDISIKPIDYYKIDNLEMQVESVKGANLKGRNLNNADMSYAFLVKTDLRGALLKGANLESANLQKAKIGEANLQEADLRNANLQKAFLPIANLQEAYLVNANLQGEATKRLRYGAILEKRERS